MLLVWVQSGGLNPSICYEMLTKRFILQNWVLLAAVDIIFLPAKPLAKKLYKYLKFFFKKTVDKNFLIFMW